MMVRGRALALALASATVLVGCASAPAGTYFAPPGDPRTGRMAAILHRAAFAAGDDPSRYSFAFVNSPVAAVYSDEEASFYFTEGLIRLPDPVVDAMVAHETAHEVLGHVSWRRTLSLTLSAGFGGLGLAVPGAGLIDAVVNPLVVRAFSRRQELEADQKAVEILRAMGRPTPRRTLAEALRVVNGTYPRPKEELTGLLSTQPELEERLQGLEPLEPAVPVANATRRRP